MSSNTIGSYKIFTRDSVTVIELSGKVTADLVRQMHAEYDSITSSDVQNGNDTKLLLDIDKVTDQDKQARLAGKNFLEKANYYKVAIWTKQRLLGGIANYIVRLSRTNKGSNRISFFHSKTRAINWLHEADKRKGVDPRLTIKPVIVVALLLQILTLIGWRAGNSYITSIFPDFTSISQASALCFSAILLCALFANHARNNDVVRWFFYTILGVVIYVASLNLLLKITSASIQLEQIVSPFSSNNVDAQMSIITSIGIALSAALLLQAIRIDVKKYKHANVFSNITITLLLLASLVPLGFIAAFGLDANKSVIEGYSIPTGITLLLLSYITASLLVDSYYGRVLRKINKGYIAAIGIGCLLLVFTAILVQQAQNQVLQNAEQNRQETSDLIAERIENTVDAYIDGIYAFRALYASSDQVSPKEFNSFFEGTEISDKYPGIYAVSYIAYVNESDYKALKESLETDQYLQQFKFTLPDHEFGTPNDKKYIVTHIEPENFDKSAVGIDLKNSTREPNFIAAMNKRDFAVSQSLDLGDVQGAERNLGFFITVPIYVDELDEEPEGFINAVFAYSQLFNTALSDQFNDISVEIYDSENIVYERQSSSSTPQFTSNNIFIGDRELTAKLYFSDNYAVATNELSAVRTTLLGGISTSIAITILIVVLASASARAQKLAKYITEDLELERNRLSLKNVQTKALVSSIGEGIIVIDQKGNITDVNPEAEKLLDTTADELKGKWYPKVIELINDKNERVAPKNRPDFQTIIDATPIQSRNYSIKVGSRSFPASITASPYIYNDHPIGVVIAFRDITKERELEHAKDDFIALASHQLRTPATAIKQFIGLILEGYVGKIPKEQKDLLQEAYASNERQIHITQDMLSVAKLESGTLDLNVTEINLKNIVEKVFNEHENTISDRSQKATVNLTDCTIHADENLLSMVIDNLISNASKYTPEKGTLKISLETKGNFVYFSVKDSGVGISKEDKKHLFKRFSRINNKLSEKVGGSGLGLYIAKKIIELHSGKITVESALNKGTTFTVKLPFKQKTSS